MNNILCWKTIATCDDSFANIAFSKCVTFLLKLFVPCGREYCSHTPPPIFSAMFAALTMVSIFIFVISFRIIIIGILVSLLSRNFLLYFFIYFNQQLTTYYNNIWHNIQTNFFSLIILLFAFFPGHSCPSEMRSNPLAIDSILVKL